MTTRDDEPSRRVVEQRIRNRVIDYLELASSYERQQRYEERVQIVTSVPIEVINQWEDFAGEDPLAGHDRRAVMAYSPEELTAMKAVHAVWDRAADALPDDYPNVATAQELSEWDELRRAAADALAVFAVRGRMPEDHGVA